MSYINRILHFNQLVNTFLENRKRKSIPLNTIIKMTVIGLVFQMRSLNQIFNYRTSGDRMWKNAFKGHLPRLDAAREVLKHIDPKTCTEANNSIVHKLKKNRNMPKVDGFVVVGIDGVELFSSKKVSKRNKNSLTRRSNDEIEYFSRSVVCMTVGSYPHIILGQSMLSSRDESEKDEGENTGAKRLVDGLYKEFHHFADIVVGDALYLNAPFINTVLNKNIDVVIRAKDEKRCIVQDALGLINSGSEKAQYFYSDNQKRNKIKAYDVREMEIDGVKSKLRFIQFTYEAKSKNEPIWVVTSSMADIKTIWKIIHYRWHIENNGFHQLKTYYHADHCFMKDAVETMFILNIIAFNMREAYLYCHKSGFADMKMTRIEVSEIFKQDILQEKLWKWFDSG